MWEIFRRRPQDGTISMREFFRTVVHPEDKVAFRRSVAAALHGDGVLHATTRIAARTTRAARSGARSRWPAASSATARPACRGG